MGDIQSRPWDQPADDRVTVRARDLDPDPDGDTVPLPQVPLMRGYHNDQRGRYTHIPRPRCGTGLVL